MSVPSGRRPRLLVGAVVLAVLAWSESQRRLLSRSGATVSPGRCVPLCVAVGALAAYLVVLVAVLVLAPGLLVSVLVGGITGALGVVAGIGGMVYARGTGLLP